MRWIVQIAFERQFFYIYIFWLKTLKLFVSDSTPFTEFTITIGQLSLVSTCLSLGLLSPPLPPPLPIFASFCLLRCGFDRELRLLSRFACVYCCKSQLSWCEAYRVFRCVGRECQVAAYDLLVELGDGCPENLFSIVAQLICMHHVEDPSTLKEWEVHCSICYNYDRENYII